MIMRRIMTLMIVGLFMFSSTPIFARGVAMVAEPLPEPVTTEENSTDTQPATETNAPSSKEERDARIAERKATLQEKLNAKREEILQKRCETAQTRISTLAEKARVATTKRTEVYTGFATKFDKFMEKLAEAGVDTTELEAVLATYNDMVANVANEFAEYNLALDDMIQMDCAGDPEGFEATLKEARQLAYGFGDIIKELHDYLRNDVRQAFTKAMNAYNMGEGDSAKQANNDPADVEGEPGTEAEDTAEVKTEDQTNDTTDNEVEPVENVQ